MLRDSDTTVAKLLAVKTALPERSGRKKARARAVLDRPPQLQGWSTSDADEIALRRWRGRTEITVIEALDPKHSVFGGFRVRSESGSAYDVEIRSLGEHGLYRSSRQWAWYLQAHRGRARALAPARWGSPA